MNINTNISILQKVQDEIIYLINTYHNKNPYYLADCLGIKYRFVDFQENLSAFSVRSFPEDNGTIFINQSFGSYSRKILCAHELGHLRLHRQDADNLFDKCFHPLKEYEANYFAALLIPQLIRTIDISKLTIDEFNDYITRKVI